MTTDDQRQRTRGEFASPECHCRNVRGRLGNDASSTVWPLVTELTFVLRSTILPLRHRSHHAAIGYPGAAGGRC